MNAVLLHGMNEGDGTSRVETVPVAELEEAGAARGSRPACSTGHLAVDVHTGGKLAVA